MQSNLVCVRWSFSHNNAKLGSSDSCVDLMKALCHFDYLSREVYFSNDRKPHDTGDAIVRIFTLSCYVHKVNLLPSSI
jgi:hypothetical protein